MSDSTHTPKILLLADGDSRIAWVHRLGALLGRAMYESDACCMFVQGSVETVCAALFREKKLDATALDIVLMGFGGGGNLKFSREFSEFFSKPEMTRRPSLLAGFNGICDAEDPHALFLRTGADIVFANCANDLKKFDSWLQYSSACQADKVELLGYVAHTEVRTDSKNNRQGEAKTPCLLFVGQPSVPRSLKERLYILYALKDIAERHPNWRIIIKPRSSPFDLNVTHVEKFHYQEMCRVFMGCLPANLQFSYESIHRLLDEATLCVTLGSTVAIEAIGRGMATIIMSDFGIRRDYGNHHFVGSQCLAPLLDLNLNERPDPINAEWQGQYLAFASDNIPRIVQRLKAMLEKQARDGEPLPLPAAIYDKAVNPYVATDFFRHDTAGWKNIYFASRRKIINAVKKIKM